MVAEMVTGRLADWSGHDRDDYLAHSNDVPLLSIRDDVELERALAKLNELIDAGAVSGELSAGAERYFDALTDLVGTYEDRTVDIPQVSGTELLRYLMNDRGMQQKDLVSLLGSKSVVSEVLSGKRRLGLIHVAKLGAYFGLPADAFIDVPATASAISHR